MLSGLRGLGALLAFGLAAFAGTAALRQLGLSVRAARRSGQPVWRAVMGRSNGGMVVHIGVVIIAVAFAASSSYGHRAQFRLTPGQSAHLAGHSLTYLGSSTVDHANKKTTAAKVRVDGGKVYEPALNQFPFGSQAIGTPSVKSGPLSDVYLTLVVPADDTGTVVIGVNVQPLIAWLWTGGAIMGFGTFLAGVAGPPAPAGRARRRARARRRTGRSRAGGRGPGERSGAAVNRRLVWAAMALVLVVALAAGSRGRAGPPTEDQRVQRIAAVIRCPTCQGLSAAQSDAPSSRGHPRQSAGGSRTARPTPRSRTTWSAGTRRPSSSAPSTGASACWCGPSLCSGWRRPSPA